MEGSAERPTLERFPFTYGGVMREVFHTTEPQNQAVVIMHELGGLGHETVELAEYLSDDFQVYLPLIHGRLGQKNRLRDTVPGSIEGMCVRAEFLGMQSDRSSPIAEWMRGLCRQVAVRHGGNRVGVIGMCFTGGLVFSMAWDPSVGAAVAAQPSLPLYRKPEDITVSDTDMAATTSCLRTDTRMVMMRFAEDAFSPAERTEAITRAMGDLAGAAPEADEAGSEPALTTVTYERTVEKGIQHSTLTFDAADTRDPTYERSRNRVRNFMLDALRP
jgi:dienelactone hydrolase